MPRPELPVGEVVNQGAIENAAGQAIESSGSVPGTSPPPSIPADQAAAQAAIFASNDDQATNSAAPASPTTSHLMADDNDLIEKEWIIKAKNIVNSTKNDPYLQNKEITKVKADYIHKRYGKTIKLTED